MMNEQPSPLRRLTPLMRGRESHADSRVSFAELFFDLVFVYAIAQLSHYLLAHFTPLGAVQTLLLTLAVWWQWVFTTWITNWLNPERDPVRLMLMALMLLGLGLSTSIHDAFGSGAMLFALAMAAMHLFRTGFALWAMWGSVQQSTMTRVLVWASTQCLVVDSRRMVW